MAAESTPLHEKVRDLERRRDELKLKMHLAKADARAEWEKAEHKWTEVRRDLKQAEIGAGQALEDIGRGVGALVDEIGDAYKRIRGSLSS